MKPGNLEGDSGGTNEQTLGAKPPNVLLHPPSRFLGFIVHPWPVSYPGYLYRAMCYNQDEHPERNIRGSPRKEVGGIGMRLGMFGSGFRAIQATKEWS